jgi:adenylate cyclase
MAIEIERKFLVKSDAWREGATAIPILQGYIFATPAKSVRVRTLGDLGFITVKSGRTGQSTNEFEYEIPLIDAKELLELACEQPTIEKIRYTREDHGHTWEIDVFKAANAGLVVAEVELARVGEPVELPSWVGEEVTGDPRYFNASLFKNPFHNWRQDL